jgi:peptidoglycan hydrolase CwlO-like protein
LSPPKKNVVDQPDSGYSNYLRDQERLTRSEERTNFLEYSINDIKGRLNNIDEKLDKSISCIPLLEQNLSFLTSKVKDHSELLKSQSKDVLTNTTRSKIFTGVSITVVTGILMGLVKVLFF